MNPRLTDVKSHYIQSSPKQKMTKLRFLKRKYKREKSNLKNFDRKYIGYSPLSHHNDLQKKFGTKSLNNIKNALKIQAITNNEYSNNLSKSKKSFNVNKRLDNRIHQLQGKTFYHEDNHHFSIPHWKIQYLKIHNIKKRKLLKLKIRIRILRSHRNYYTNRNKSKINNDLQKLIEPTRNYHQSPILIKHNIYNKPTMNVKTHHINTNYQHPKHPQRFMHRGFSI